MSKPHQDETYRLPRRITAPNLLGTTNCPDEANNLKVKHVAMSGYRGPAHKATNRVPSNVHLSEFAEYGQSIFNML